MLLLVALGLAATLLRTVAIEVAYEQMDQPSGFNVMQSTLRVRKYNRTAMVLNGTVEIKIDLDDTYVVHMDMFHSRLGNQQFNHYPFKLPTSGICKFIQVVHEDYPHVVKAFINYPKKGECPVTPRSVHIIDHVFPPNVVPSLLPRGLWKTVVNATKDNESKFIFELIVKVTSSLD